MDRKRLEERLAANAVKAELIPVLLPSGDSLMMRKLTNDEMIRVFTAAGQEADRDARVFTNSMRFCLVDDVGEPLLRSFEEAAAFVNTLDEADFAALGEALGGVQPAAADDGEVVEAGKVS